MSANKGFAVIGEHDVDQEPAQREQTVQAAQLLALSLRTISQRLLTSALVAWNAAFTIGIVASAWMLWARALPHPDIAQLVELGMYAMFALAIEIIRRKR